MPHFMAWLSTCNTSCVKNNRSSNETEAGNEDTLLPPPLIVLLFFMCLLIVAVNGFVIFLTCQRKILRTLTNMFLTSLAISDLMSGLVGIPLLAICLVKDIIMVCVSSTIFIRFTAISSVCHVLLIASDRYMFIVHDMKYHSIVTKWRAIASIFSIWLLSFLASVIQLSWHNLDEAALTEFESRTQDIDIKYSLACIALFFAVPLLFMCYIYGHIFYISFKRNKTDRQLNKNLQQPSCRSLLQEWRGRSVLLITMVIFAGCWLPFFLMVLDAHMESSPFSLLPVSIERLLVFLGFLPPLLNPVLCTLAKKDFRHALKEVVLRREPSRQCEGNCTFSSRAQTVTKCKRQCRGQKRRNEVTLM
ncbi:melanocyte-stimulating hormone receptor-like [Orbicella faveolata]|uniref:melanocyte-stimulating hormone receptor-like n=1 Tax=Orbicella faveolata TaxID=48498 RepID=UPI0009E618A6|nr:melanocyte-stimulating hormone receptor-like [Orbicella faveolata]